MKENTTDARKALGLALLAGAWLAAPALAEPEPPSSHPAVLLFESPDRPELCAATRIAFAGTDGVECLPEAEAADVNQRLAVAARLVHERRARLGVLLEVDAAAKVIRMILVGPAPDRAALSLTPLPEAPTPDVDRSLALKAREAYDVLAEGSTETQGLEALVSPASPASTKQEGTGPRANGPVSTPAPPFQALVAAAARAAYAERLLPGAQLTLGVAYSAPRWLTALTLTGGLVGPERAGRGIALSYLDWEAGLWLHLLRPLGPGYALGAGLGLVTAAVQARFHDAAHEAERRTLWGARPGVEASARGPLWRAVAWSLDLRLSALLPRDKLAVSERVVDDRGSVRGELLVGAEWRGP